MHAERLSDDLFHDFHYSPDLQEHLNDICELLGISCKIPMERIAHRWLSSYDVTCRNVEKLDAFTVFYFAWMDVSNISACEYIVNDIIRKADPAKFLVNKKQLDRIFIKLKSKQLTPQEVSRRNGLFNGSFTSVNLPMHVCTCTAVSCLCSRALCSHLSKRNL